MKKRVVALAISIVLLNIMVQATPITKTNTNLPINIKDGDYLTYEIRVKGNGPEGAIETSGKVTLKIQIRGNELALHLANSELNTDAIATIVVFDSLSDLVQVIGMGTESTYELPSLYKSIGPKCLVLRPGENGEIEGKYTYVSISTTKYTCKYSNGVLTSLEAKIYGNYSEKSFSIELQSYLKDTSLEGVRTESGFVGLRNTVIIAALAVALLLGTVTIILVRRR